MSTSEALDRFVENIKNNTHLYIEKHQPISLDQTIQLAQSYNSIRYGGYRGMTRGRNIGGRRGRFYNDGRNGGYNGNNQGNGYPPYQGRGNGRYNGGRTYNGGRYNSKGRSRGQISCYRCGQPGYVAPDCTTPSPQ